jgi:hypothetical protein
MLIKHQETRRHNILYIHPYHPNTNIPHILLSRLQGPCRIYHPARLRVGLIPCATSTSPVLGCLRDAGPGGLVPVNLGECVVRAHRGECAGDMHRKKHVQCSRVLAFPYEQEVMRSQVRRCLSWLIIIVDLFLGQGRFSILSLTFQNGWEHCGISVFVHFIMSALNLHE